MKKSLNLTIAVSLVLIGCQNTSTEKTVHTDSVTAQAVKDTVQLPDTKHGAYLVEVLGCRDCHSPKKFGEHGPYPDPALDLSGHPANYKLAEYDAKTASKWVLFNEHNTAVVGPWGVSFAANITSDPSGIGNWSEEQFIKAIREGKAKGLDGSRMLLPPMPWPSYSKLSDHDLKSIFAYLQTVKPVDNIVPAPLPPGGTH